MNMQRSNSDPDYEPFGGFDIGDVTWDEGEPPQLSAKGQRRVDAGKRARYMVAARVEPKDASGLRAFGQAIVNRLGGGIDIPVPKEGDRAIYLLMHVTARSPMAAISVCAYRADRAIKRTGQAIERITWDTKALTGADAQTGKQKP